VLITGGAGFVGSRLALAFRTDRGNVEVVAFDNLRRRGSELNLPRLARHGVRFVHGDVRQRGDLDDLPGTFDVVIDASAEPSVHAGLEGSPGYVVDTNLTGTLNCLELARARAGAFVFLSTSRVYALAPLRGLRLEEGPTRLVPAPEQDLPGITAAGIDESFPTNEARSLYGATKLAGELFVQEYASAFGVPGVIDRCGVIAGAGQFGRSEQGVVALWVARHHFGLPLAYTGFGGEGKQVRDLLHPDDLFALLEAQIEAIDRISGRVFNVGGGPEGSVSMRELTDLCRAATEREVAIGRRAETSPVDIPWYVSDAAGAAAELGWRPDRTPADMVAEIAAWLAEEEAALRPILAPVDDPAPAAR
jgi:CDP-paratose 2-epimerase